MSNWHWMIFCYLILSTQMQYSPTLWSNRSYVHAKFYLPVSAHLLNIPSCFTKSNRVKLEWRLPRWKYSAFKFPSLKKLIHIYRHELAIDNIYKLLWSFSMSFSPCIGGKYNVWMYVYTVMYLLAGVELPMEFLEGSSDPPKTPLSYADDHWGAYVPLSFFYQ